MVWKLFNVPRSYYMPYEGTYPHEHYAVFDWPLRKPLSPIEPSADYTTQTRSRRFFTELRRRRHFWFGYLLDAVLALVYLIFTLWFYTGPSPPAIYFRPDDPDLQFPVVTDLVSNVMATILAFSVPIGTILFCYVVGVFGRNHWDTLHGLLGFFEAIAFTEFLTGFFWAIFGGLRPNFLAVCMPNKKLFQEGVTYYTTEICTGELAKSDLQAFPSGHSSSTWCGMTFIVLWLFAKVKPFDNTAHFWKSLIFLPWLLSLYVSFGRVRDGHHFPHQVFAGFLIGVLSAVMAYRLNYISLFGIDNHVPAKMVWGWDRQQARQNVNRDEKSEGSSEMMSADIPIEGESSANGLDHRLTAINRV